MPRLCAAILLAGIAVAAVLPRRRPPATTDSIATGSSNVFADLGFSDPAAEIRSAAERLMLLYGPMPSRDLH